MIREVIYGLFIVSVASVFADEIRPKIADDPGYICPAPSKPGPFIEPDLSEPDWNNPCHPCPAGPPKNTIYYKKWPREIEGKRKCESCTMPNLIIPSYWDKVHQNCKCECHHRNFWAESRSIPVPMNPFIERNWNKLPPHTLPYFPQFEKDKFFFPKKKKNVGSIFKPEKIKPCFPPKKPVGKEVVQLKHIFRAVKAALKSSTVNAPDHKSDIFDSCGRRVERPQMKANDILEAERFSRVA